MSCRELEILFLADAPASAVAAHRSGCPVCDALAADLERTSRLTAELRPPEWSSNLRRTLLAIPSTTLTCERADEAIAAALEGELPAPERRRLESHLSRCAACAEGASTLATARELVSPTAAPWLTGRIAAARPSPPRRSPWAWLLGPKGAITVAYAAAVLVMLLGFNPADFARGRAAGRIKEETRVAAKAAGVSIADRLGALEERAARAVLAARGRFGAYGRAALSTALNLVMRPENPPPSNRPRSGDDRSTPQKTQTEITTWRA